MTSPTPVTMVTVATQTDGCVEIGYQELLSTTTTTAVDIYDYEDDEFESGNITNNKQHRVMSSQTDLALSDFDLERFEWEDEEEEDEGELEEGRLYRVLEDYNHLPQLESSGNTVEEQVYEPSICKSERPDMLKPSAMYEALTGLNRPPNNSEVQIPPKRQESFIPSAEEVVRNMAKQSCRIIRPLTGYCGMKILMNKLSRVQLENDESQTSCDPNAASQPPFPFRNRMVPRMGTKVEFLKNLSENSTFQLPAGICQNSLKSEAFVDGTFGDTKTDRHAIDLFGEPDIRPNYILNAYHSDSEHSYASIRETGSHHRDWSSDGDADSFSQTLNADIRQSISFIDTELLSPESRSKVESLRHRYDQFADIMYTNQANLQHTIMVQQCLFKQQLASRQKKDDLGNKATVHVYHTLLPETPSFESPDGASGVQDQAATSQGKCKYDKKSQLEWIAKRRPDGSRYITRRPVKSKFLKERARQLAAQHHNLQTTDEETVSEVKIGCYWNKEQRKRHLEKSRRLKRQKGSQQNTPACVVKEDLTKQDGAPPAPQQHKVSKYQSRRVHENFTTLKDLMLNKGGGDCKGKSFSPLLSVTTI